MPPFHLEYYPRSEKDLEKLRDPAEALRIIDEIAASLASNPFPNPPKKKRIKGFSWPLFRLRVDTAKDSYRIFYLFKGAVVTILRIVKKKDAEKVIRSLR